MSEVAETELQKFEKEHNKRVLRIGGPGESSDEVTSMGPIMNYLCSQLWHRDQQLLAIKT